MQILQVKKYNSQDMQKWHKAVDEWKQDHFTNNIIPQIMFYGFRSPNGELRKTGYVAFDDKSAYFARTKKEVITKYFLEGIK